MRIKLTVIERNPSLTKLIGQSGWRMKSHVKAATCTAQASVCILLTKCGLEITKVAISCSKWQRSSEQSIAKPNTLRLHRTDLDPCLVLVGHRRFHHIDVAD